MKNKKSYAEIMKTRNTANKDYTESSVLDIYIQMILDDAAIRRELAELEGKIDDALAERNESSFMELSKRYAELKQMV
ncbi:IDEAL domain-containing protein [Metabacillus sp. RGM 3146]|uniref:IDEAL domain-containing protein n=1 Tax=Metabacillus sp. RGM 3146 TaxID=3401092 RepID=UPI003B9BB23B